MPSTYHSDMMKPLTGFPLAFMPMKLMVIGIMGKTHGVRLASTPPRKTIRNASQLPPSSAANNRSCRLPPDVAADGAVVPPSPSATSIVNDAIASAGG